MKKVSIVTPCYNVEKYITQFLDCIINQTIGINNIELILIDDASTDSTPDIIRNYERLYPDTIIAIFNDTNLKQGTCRNIALDNYVSSEYFCFIDSDDIVPLYYLEYLYNIAQDNLADVIQLKFSYDLAGIPESKNMLTYNTFICDNEEKRKQLIIGNDYLNESCTCKFILKSYYDKYHFHFAEGVAYEEPLFTHPIKHTANIICRINEPLYYYRRNPDGTMLSYMQNYDTIYQHMFVQLETFNYVKNNIGIDKYIHEMELYFLHSFCYETISFLNTRHMPVTIELFRYMCSVTNMIIPDISSNPYFGVKGTYSNKAIADYINQYNQGADINEILNELKNIF